QISFRLLELECDFALSLRRHCDLRFLRAEIFLPRFERVVSRRKIAQLELAVCARYREVRVVDYSDPSVHPRMDIALHADHHFGRHEVPHQRIRTWVLTLVPLAIV